jgi:hypothetical protein
VIVSHVIKCDYPGRWALLPEKIATFIQSENTMQWMGALMSLYQMVKVYEYVMLNTKTSKTLFGPVILSVFI